MKIRLCFFILLAGLFFPFLVFAQVAKIIDLEGQVMVRPAASSDWGKAKLGALLNKDAELETKDNSYCTLAFDEEQRNIVTLKQNSHIKIDSIKPGNIFLPQGRVFSLIKNLSKNEKFQIRTPTAIAGARGTGWVTDYNGSNTQAKCFDDLISVQGLDTQGNNAGEKDLSSGSGIGVGSSGTLGDTYNLGDADYTEWNDFSGYCGDLTGQGNNNGQDNSNNPALGDLRQEQRDNTHQESSQEQRENVHEDSTPSDSGGGDGFGDGDGY